MKVGFISSEVVPFAKTGGLADVSGALPKALFKLDCDVKIFLPKYDCIIASKFKLRKLFKHQSFEIKIGFKYFRCSFFTCKYPGTNIDVYFIGQEDLFNKGKLYSEDNDEPIRFIFFQKAVIELMQLLKWAPDIIHCNDWQTGLIPFYIKNHYSWDRLFEKTKTLFTIHNIGYQGTFEISDLINNEFPDEFFNPISGAEYFGKVSFLKAGLIFSDMISTVSKTYAKEILTPEYGNGMEGVLQSQKNKLTGIVNGVDYEVWNPEIDPSIPFNYNLKTVSLKVKNKQYLLKELNMNFDKNLPLIGMISRVVSQKGFDILADAVKYLVKLPAKWVILGTGDKKYEDKIIDIAQQYPDHLKANLFYNDELAHIIEAAADIFLMPSKYEPCGLNQIYSLKYGTIPVVRAVGGLEDTVLDWDENIRTKKGNGFKFKEYNSFELYFSVKRAIMTFQNKRDWQRLVENAMSKDFSWDKSAKEYLKLYKKMKD